MKDVVISTNKGDIRLLICEGLKVVGRIFWSFGEVQIESDKSKLGLGGYRDKCFVGSSRFLSDESFEFNADSLILESASLFVPEENFDGKEALDLWLSVTCVEGSLMISDKLKFGVESPSDWRFLSIEHDALIVLNRAAVIPDKESYRLRINPQIDLLVFNSRYCGFILYEPFNKLTPFENETVFDGDSLFVNDDFKECLVEYFNIANEPDWDKLDSADNETKLKIEEILSRLSGLEDSSIPINSLCQRCRSLLDEYFE